LFLFNACHLSCFYCSWCSTKVWLVNTNPYDVGPSVACGSGVRSAVKSALPERYRQPTVATICNVVQYNTGLLV
jgi:hypothetical protein